MNAWFDNSFCCCRKQMRLVIKTQFNMKKVAAKTCKNFLVFFEIKDFRSHKTLLLPTESGAYVRLCPLRITEKNLSSEAK